MLMAVALAGTAGCVPDRSLRRLAEVNPGPFELVADAGLPVDVLDDRTAPDSPPRTDLDSPLFDGLPHDCSRGALPDGACVDDIGAADTPIDMEGVLIDVLSDSVELVADVPVVPPTDLGRECESDLACSTNGGCLLGSCTTICKVGGQVIGGACSNPFPESPWGPLFGCPADMDLCMPGGVDGKDLICRADSDCAAVGLAGFVCAGAFPYEDYEAAGRCVPAGSRKPAGGSCQSSDGSDCTSLLCLHPGMDNDLPGMCSAYCDEFTSCPVNTTCAIYPIDDSGEVTRYGAFCVPIKGSMKACESALDCPMGEEYCGAVLGPDGSQEVFMCMDSPNALGAWLGEPCETAKDCFGPYCAFEAWSDKLDAYCIQHCKGEGDCSPDMMCREVHVSPFEGMNPDSPYLMHMCLKVSAGSPCYVGEENACEFEWSYCEPIPGGLPWLGECANGQCPPGACGTCGECTETGECGQVAAGTDPNDDCGACHACGEDWGCTSVEEGQDPKDNCQATDPALCKTTGGCDGTGDCAYWPPITKCADAYCEGDVYHSPGTCDGQGTCQQAPPLDCAPFACAGSGSPCLDSCTEYVHCAEGYMCVAGTCEEAPLCPGLGKLFCGVTLPGTTVGMPNNWEDYSACLPIPYTGPERVYSFLKQQDMTVTVTVLDSDFDVGLFLLDHVCSPELACISSADYLPAGGQESIAFSAKAGGQYYLAVDGFGQNESGPFMISTDCCAPQCTGKVCGDDGCGGTCGACPSSFVCVAGQCVCSPNCAGKECGPDGCGGECGLCAQVEDCEDGQCICTNDGGFESNDSCASAKPITAGVYNDLAICPGGDQDWYSIQVGAGQTLTVETMFVHDSGDLDLYLYKQGNCVGYLDSASTSTDNEALSHFSPSLSTYLIRVNGFSSEVSNSYSLKTSVQ